MKLRSSLFEERVAGRESLAQGIMIVPNKDNGAGARDKNPK